MLNIFLFCLLINSVNCLFPYQNNFYLEYYLGNNCSNISRVTKIPIYCNDIDLINDYPSCCWNVLDQFQLEYNSSFNSCYTYDSNKSISYQCNTINDYPLVEKIFYLIGLGSFAILIMAFCSYCCFLSVNKVKKRNTSIQYGSFSPLI